jgi:hypothetical protein
VANIYPGTGTVANTSRAPSANIWGTCPWDELISGQNGYAQFEDFVGQINPVTAEGYTLTAVTSGTLATYAESGGVLLLSSNGHNAAYDGGQIQTVAPCWDPGTTGELWFECRVKGLDWDTVPDDMFCGLASLDTTIMANNVLDETNNSHLLFYCDVNSTPGRVGFSCSKAGVESVDADLTGAAALVDSTYIKFGITLLNINGTRTVTPYVNGVPFAAITGSTYIPAVPMSWSFGTHCGTNHAQTALLYIDSVKTAVRLHP